MADAAAKREARRRRILENSENRLQRITGRISENPAEDKETLGLPPIPKPSNNGLSTEEITRDLINSFSQGDRFPHLESNETHEQATLSSHQQALLFGQTLRNNFDIDALNERLRPRTQGDLNPVDNDDNLRQPTSITKSFSTYWILYSDVSYLFLALIINILCLLNLDHWFGKTILMPYFAMTIARLLFHQSWLEPQKSNMLTAALILCNINPKLVHKLITFYTIVRKIYRGFALYIFSFVMIRWILSQFWAELDISVPADWNSGVPFDSTT